MEPKDLPQPTIPADATPLMKYLIPLQQAQSDEMYLHGPVDSVDAWNTAVDGWIASELHAREQAPDPAHYTPTFSRKPPVRTLIMINDDKASFRAEPDPTLPNWSVLHKPELPPWVPPQAPGGFKSGAIGQQDAVAAALATLLQQNGQIISMLQTLVKGVLR